MTRAPLTFAGILLALLGASEANAEPCPLEVTLSGEQHTTATLSTVLGERGIATVDIPTLPACPIVHARVASRGEALALVIERLDGSSIERIVDLETAATVIESFVRTDLAEPLLETRPRPIAVAEVPRRETHLDAVAPIPAGESRGIQLFAAAETSYANDRTSWVGLQVGACVILGPVCVAARLRGGVVANVPRAWGTVERRNSELLLGLDIPIGLGRMTVSPGFAAGIGQTHTHVEGVKMGSETGGLRADVHATLTIPLSARLAIDVSLAGDLTQATNVKTNTTMQLPDDPRGLVRLGVGLRYGGL